MSCLASLHELVGAGLELVLHDVKVGWVGDVRASGVGRDGLGGYSGHGM